VGWRVGRVNRRGCWELVGNGEEGGGVRGGKSKETRAWCWEKGEG